MCILYHLYLNNITFVHPHGNARWINVLCTWMTESGKCWWWPCLVTSGRTILIHFNSNQCHTITITWCSEVCCTNWHNWCNCRRWRLVDCSHIFWTHKRIIMFMFKKWLSSNVGTYILCSIIYIFACKSLLWFVHVSVDIF